MASPRDIQRLRALVARAQSVRYVPHAPTAKQASFLTLDCLEALYGGQAGGGKSDALLMGALAYADTPGASVMLLRRSYKDLNLPGAIMDRAAEWLRPTGANWSDRDKRWTFPSGARLSFGYLDHEADKFRYASAEFQFLGFDELTQFNESQYVFMLSRVRRMVNSPMPLQVRSASNPGGIGHDWVYARFVDPATRGPREFISASLHDNPHIDRESYHYALSSLDPTTRAQLLEGKWIRDSNSLMYQYTPANLVEYLPTEHTSGWRYVLAVDLGAREDQPTTAFVLLAWHPQISDVAFVVESAVKPGLTPSDIAEQVREYDQTYGGLERIVVDQGALGKGYIKEFQTRWGIPAQPAEKTNKLGFRKLLNGALVRNQLRIVVSRNQDLLDEMRQLTWNPEGTDNARGHANHMTDALLYGYRACLAWTGRTPEPQPDRGSAAYWERWERDQIELEEAEVTGANDRPWWDTRQ